MKVILKKGKEWPLRRRHPWIFSGAIARVIGDPKDGETVDVYNHEDLFMAKGHYFHGSIAVKILTFEEESLDATFWSNRVARAYQKRKANGYEITDTSAFRLIHGEGDQLPGLVIDIYARHVIVQCHTTGMFKARKSIKTGLLDTFGDQIRTIYLKSKATLPKQFAMSMEDGYLHGEHSKGQVDIIENGCTYHVNWEQGQKTGFFLDQRVNRDILGQFAKGKSVLNTFCYSGGFSIQALISGAEKVCSVDVSAKAIELLEQHISVNDVDASRHKAVKQDVLQFFKEQDELYDIVILDPPAYAKSIKKRHKAVQAYKRLNMAGINTLKQGGFLFTFSCSQVVDNQLFYDTVMAACIEAGRPASVLMRLTQPSDHPVNIFHPEGNYLKGLVLYIE